MTIKKEVKQRMLNHGYWDQVAIYELLYIVLQIVDLEVFRTMPFMYELVCVMKTNINHLRATS